MILLTARDLTRQFDAAPVFSGLGLEIRSGDRVGLVGPNGSGKTTLLKILARLDDPDTGVVEQPNRVRVELLQQQTESPVQRTLWEEVALGLQRLYRLQQEAITLAEQMGEGDGVSEAILQRYDQVHTELQQQSGFELDHRVSEVLSGLGFDSEDFPRPLQSFSGGEQARAALGRLLLTEPDVMLLDEPTNHLDIAATEWLEGFLGRARPALLLVSHDRYFLDKVVNRVLELRQDRLDSYKGNFSAYFQQRAERQRRLQKQVDQQEEFVARTEQFIRKHQYGQKHRQAGDRVRKLQRVEQIETLSTFDSPPMTFGDPSRSGDLVVEASGIAKSFEETLFTNLDLRIERGQRLGILGPNGSGKTTLLKILIGELAPDAGSVRLGTGVQLAYFDQGLASISPQTDLVEAIRPPGNPDITPGILRGLLARFGLRGDIVLQNFGSLSGGEQSKTALARLAAINANLLVLDEPTNHLDLWARDGLETALREFAGTVLFVTHDRFFIDRVATDVLVLEENGCAVYEGNYSEYLAFQSSTRQDQDETASEAKPKIADGRASEEKQKRPQWRFPYRKVADIEQDLDRAEDCKRRLETELADSDVARDPERIRQVKQDYAAILEEIDELSAHWEEATERN